MDALFVNNNILEYFSYAHVSHMHEAGGVGGGLHVHTFTTTEGAHRQTTEK